MLSITVTIGILLLSEKATIASPDSILFPNPKSAVPSISIERGVALEPISETELSDLLLFLLEDT
jgi:hypothetical protein